MYHLDVRLQLASLYSMRVPFNLRRGSSWQAS